jgi:hypothetical protein
LHSVKIKLPLRRNFLKDLNLSYKDFMKYWLLNIGLFTSLFMFVFSTDMKAGANNQPVNEPGAVISDFYFHLNGSAALCLVNEEIIDMLSEKTIKMSFHGQSYAAIDNLICINKSLFSGSVQKESFSNNHVSFQENLYSCRHSIYGYSQQQI